jgi:putative transposase
MDVFVEKEDRHVFLRMLEEASKLYSLSHNGYSLMTNHIHLISIPKEVTSLSRAMRDALGSYASYFNRKYGLTGGLWQGRFYSTVLDETHYWAALRYVERNAVRAGVVRSAEEYEWSSAAAHCGIRADSLLTPLPAIPDFIGCWAWLLEGEDDQDQMKMIRNNTKTGRPCGSELFVEELEYTLDRPLKQRQRGHKKKPESKSGNQG